MAMSLVKLMESVASQTADVDAELSAWPKVAEVGRVMYFREEFRDLFVSSLFVYSILNYVHVIYFE